MSNLVQIEHVMKHYGMNKVIFQDLNLNLESGKIVGLLGPNGSGKTTLIKMLAGLLSPAQGSIHIDGNEIGPYTKAIVSYLPERTYFNESLKVRKFLADIVLALLSYVAENERINIRQRQAEGIAAAKAKGIKFGRPPVPLPDCFDEVCRQWKTKKISMNVAAQLCGMTKSTFYNKACNYKKVV